VRHLIRLLLNVFGVEYYSPSAEMKVISSWLHDSIAKEGLLKGTIP
jgi:hypothetical protein